MSGLGGTLVVTMLCLGGAVLLGLGACGGRSEIDVGHSDDGSTIRADVGDLIVLRLGENPTTGYSWGMTLSQGLRLVNDEFVADEAPGDVVGSGGVHEWRIEVLEAGTQTVEGGYRRPWEPGSETGSFSLTVDVT